MNLRTDDAPRRKRHRTVAAATVAVLGIGAALGTAAAAQGVPPATLPYSNISAVPFDITLGVGADETQRIASWYISNNTAQALEIEKTSELTAGAFNTSPSHALISAQSAANTSGSADTTTTDTDTKNIAGVAAESGYYNAHATISSLQPSTSYTYRVGAANGSNWSTAYTFTTAGTSNNFDFLFFGDPQIGSSGDPDADAAGWKQTLDYATTNTPGAELLVSGGDQVEHANNEYEWAAFTDSNDVLKRYPWAATIGNHDVGGKAYEQHYKVPNVLKSATYYPNPLSTDAASGGDYWYIWKDVLFIDLNSNAYAAGADAAHVSYVQDVVDRVGSKAKWKVLVYHHSIYSPADHANDVDNQQRRLDFTKAFSDMGINLVLQGHDHSYSRSYAILNGKKANVAEQPGQSEVFSGPGGVIYVTANSSSGSKYYDLTKPDATQGGYGADPLDPSGNRHWANSVENQEHVRTYIKVSVSDDKLNVTDVRAGDCSAPNAAYTRGNVKTCGVTAETAAANSTPDPAAVGSAVDQFTLDAQAHSTTTSLTVSHSSKTYGTSTAITLAATVAGGFGTGGGTVGFYDGSKLVATKTIAGGKASYTLPKTVSVGKHSYSAKFTSSSVFFGTDSTSAKKTVTVSKVKSSTALRYSRGSVTVTVKATGQTVNGTVRVYDRAKVIKTVRVVKGKVTSKLPTLRAGSTHKLRAVFATTSTIASSASRTVNVKIARR